MNVLYAFSAALGEGVGLVNLKWPYLCDPCSDIYFAGILTRESDPRRYQCSPLDENPPLSLRIHYCDPGFGKTAKDVDASQGAIIDIFEHIEHFFKRLESYTDMRPTEAMADIIIRVMVEVLSILVIATKEVKQGRASELLAQQDVPVY